MSTPGEGSLVIITIYALQLTQHDTTDLTASEGLISNTAGNNMFC